MPGWLDRIAAQIQNIVHPHRVESVPASQPPFSLLLGVTNNPALQGQHQRQPRSAVDASSMAGKLAGDTESHVLEWQRSLSRAIAANKISDVRAALFQGARLNGDMNMLHDTPLHLAIEHHCGRAVLDHLMKSKDKSGEQANFTRVNSNGHTVIHHAVINENIPFLEEVARVIRADPRRAVDLSQRDCNGRLAREWTDNPLVLRPLRAIAHAAKMNKAA